MEFLSETHKTRYEELMQRAGLQLDSGDIERKVLIFILSGNDDLYKNSSKVYDFKERNIHIEIDEDGNIYIPNLPVSSSAKALAYLATQLYNSCNKQSVMDTFRSLDDNNFKLAINAIKLRFKM